MFEYGKQIWFDSYNITLSDKVYRFVFVFTVGFHIYVCFYPQGAMNVGAEERHRLRQELAEAQERLSALKELQRQMTESGVVPPDRIILESQYKGGNPPLLILSLKHFSLRMMSWGKWLTLVEKR